MKLRCWLTAACIGVGILCLAASGMMSPTPLVRIRVTSIDAALRDIETLSKGMPTPVTHDMLLQQLAATFGTEDLSFLDLSQPAALVKPQDGSKDGWASFVAAIPVRDAARALDVLARSFPERTLDGDVTVLRSAPVETPQGNVQTTLCAAVHGRVLVISPKAELVRRFDHAAALAGENLPPGSIAFTMEVEPVAAEWKAGLNKMRQMLQRPAGEAVGAVGGPIAGGPGGEGTALDAPPSPPPAPPSPDAAGVVGASSPSGMKPLLVVGDVRPPELTSKVTPEYPEEARRAHVEGNVVLEAIISAEGDVENIRVLRSVPMLDAPAIEAVKQWKYKPAMKDGQPVRVFFTVVVTFTLRDTPPGQAPADPSAQAAGAPSAMPFDSRKLAGMFDLYVGLMNDAIDGLSKMQASLEVANGYLVVHGRGVARDGSSLRKFIDAQRDLGLPAIGRMMPVGSPVIVAGQLNWTEPSRAWMKQLMQKSQAAMADFVKLSPEADRAANEESLQRMSLWYSQSGNMTDCLRGDIALAIDPQPEGMQILSVQGVADTEACRGVLASAIAGMQHGAGGKALIVKEVLEPEKVPTYTFRQKQMRIAGQGDASAPTPELTFRYAQIGTLMISGTDEWASRAIREAAAVQEGNVPGGGGLVLADLGPFTQRPGIFGRVQIGTLLRQAADKAKSREGAARNDEMIRALEGPAGAIPFAMRFDEGAATIEFAMPLAMLEAFAKSVPKPPPPPDGGGPGAADEDVDEP